MPNKPAKSGEEKKSWNNWLWPFYQQILRLSWREHVTNEEVLRKQRAKKIILLTVRKRHEYILGNIISKICLENVTLTRCIKGKKSLIRMGVTYLRNLSKEKEEKVKKNINVNNKNRRSWRTLFLKEYSIQR